MSPLRRERAGARLCHVLHRLLVLSCYKAAPVWNCQHTDVRGEYFVPNCSLWKTPHKRGFVTFQNDTHEICVFMGTVPFLCHAVTR